jgi:hypothetical protein
MWVGWVDVLCFHINIATLETYTKLNIINLFSYKFSIVFILVLVTYSGECFPIEHSYVRNWTPFHISYLRIFKENKSLVQPKGVLRARNRIHPNTIPVLVNENGIILYPDCNFFVTVKLELEIGIHKISYFSMKKCSFRLNKHFKNACNYFLIMVVLWSCCLFNRQEPNITWKYHMTSHWDISGDFKRKCIELLNQSTTKQSKNLYLETILKFKQLWVDV